MELKDIKSPKDIKNLSIPELENIAAQMRNAILNRTSKIGGHVGPNLGSVESIIALHYVFDAPEDRLVYDVSHQAFPHKMLTGRVDGYLFEEDFAKVGEYTDPKECPEYDLFYAGHTSPALSLCVGLAKARDLQKQKYNVVAYVGDGALSGGVAFEGLDAGGALNSNLICIFNDNQMAIAENHGGMYSHFAHLRETNGTATDNLFKAFGWDYIYVNDGNNLEKLIAAYSKAKDSAHPVVIHINTQKGEGYTPAEEYRERFHYRDPYIISSGALRELGSGPSYGGVFKKFVLEGVKKYPDMLVISSATPDALGLNEKDREKLGDNYLDVAIAEQTGVSVMAGAAKNGSKVVYGVVSTFLQRAYDQLMEDWAMDESPAVLNIDSTGIAAITDQTHLGFWDIPMITSIPDIVYLAPANLEEYEAMLNWALDQDKLKVAIRQPNYSVEHADYPVVSDYSDLNKFQVTHEGAEVAIIAVGDWYVRGKEVAELLKQKGIDATLINPRFVSGVDAALLTSLSANHKVVATIENGSLEGGFGQKVASALGASDLKVLNFGLKKEFIDRYNVKEVEKAYGLLPNQIADSILHAVSVA
ncbi:MAG: 1-deoxy-D-xylulose-5-phosphate synthase [Muribaculaceae bacterium]|nr:1-deoxy-D-xylulose-5-phosphate synthase [Muribaculaceae bacterium]